MWEYLFYWEKKFYYICNIVIISREREREERERRDRESERKRERKKERERGALIKDAVSF